MGRKILITISEDHVAPRFDLATEVLVLSLDSEGNIQDRRTMVLPQASPEDLCHLILTEGAGIVICGGIEEEYYQYLQWKKVKVMDSVMGPYTGALDKLAHGPLGQESDLLSKS